MKKAKHGLAFELIPSSNPLVAKKLTQVDRLLGL